MFKRSNHINGAEKQFVVDFISTIFDQPYSWEFDLIPFISTDKIELTVSNIGKFSELYQKADLDDGSKRDRAILQRAMETLEKISEEVQSTQEEVIEDYEVLNLVF